MGAFHDVQGAGSECLEIALAFLRGRGDLFGRRPLKSLHEGAYADHRRLLRIAVEPEDPYLRPAALPLPELEEMMRTGNRLADGTVALLRAVRWNALHEKGSHGVLRTLGRSPVG